MKAKEYKILVDCVERGIEYGMSRAYKHTDSPTMDYIISQLNDNVLTEICEYFQFDDYISKDSDGNV
jgi:hypothetical protein